MSEPRYVPSYYASNRCFFCSPLREDGLRLRFEELPGEAPGDLPRLRLRWLADPTYSGFGSVLHGGIQGALFDEIMGWCSRHATGEPGVTREYRVEFLAPVHVGQEIEIVCRVTERKGRLARLAAELRDARGVLCARAEGTYALLSREKFTELTNIEAPL